MDNNDKYNTDNIHNELIRVCDDFRKCVDDFRKYKDRVINKEQQDRHRHYQSVNRKII